MLAKRIIPCLDVDAGRVVKGVKFVDIRDAGDPVEVARRYNEEGADETLDERESKRRIADCLEVLDEREYRIVRDYYGFGNLPPMTLEQIGGSLGVTRERVRQLRNRALEKLRESCGETLVQLSEN